MKQRSMIALFVHLFSLASRIIFSENNSTSLKNYFNEKISLEGDWLWVKIFFHKTNNFHGNDVINCSHMRIILIKRKYQKELFPDWTMEIILIRTRKIHILELIVRSLKRTIGLRNFSSKSSENSGILILF